jgi:hypothetical protein
MLPKTGRIHMEVPIGKEIDILELSVGEKYYGFQTNRFQINKSLPRFRGVFTEYWINDGNYDMLRFHHVYSDYGDMTTQIGSKEEHPVGLRLRIFEGDSSKQSYRYYKVSRFTEKEKKELYTRYILRKRRQYERGLTGSRASELYLPRDIVRHISLNYLTQKAVGCAGRWR